MKQTRSKYSSPEEKRLGRLLAVKTRQNQPHTVYLLRNKHTNQIYIGSSYHAFSRFGIHLASALNGCVDCPKLYDSMRIYKNYQDWHFAELFQVENSFLAKEAEDYMIIFYDSINNGLNTRLNGEIIVSNDSKEKMSKTRIERKIALGVNNTKASMTENQVKEIKALLSENRTILDIESITGISAKKIRRIRSGEVWSHVDSTNYILDKKHPINLTFRSVLNTDIVKKIKELIKTGKTSKEISEITKASIRKIENIKNGISWKEV